VNAGVRVELAVVGIVLALVLWQVLTAFAAEVAPEAAVEDAALDAFELELPPAAARHATARPYLVDRPLIQQIMDAAEPVADPQGAVNTVRWDIPGTFNGRKGTWELVVNTGQKIIYHFAFVG
jgi:hypothetical protein